MATLPKSKPSDAEQAIRDLAQEWVRHHEARNLDKLVALYADDGHMLAAFAPARHGKNELRQYYQEYLTQLDPRDVTVEVDYVEAGDDVAFCVGTYAGSMRTPSGKRVEDHGKYTVGLRREGAGWKIVAHSWNTDLPISEFVGSD